MTTVTTATSAVALRKAAGHVSATSASVLTDTQKPVTHAMKGIEEKIVNSFVPKWKRERLRNPLRKSKTFRPLLWRHRPRHLDLCQTGLRVLAMRRLPRPLSRLSHHRLLPAPLGSVRCLQGRLLELPKLLSHPLDPQKYYRTIALLSLWVPDYSNPSPLAHRASNGSIRV